MLVEDRGALALEPQAAPRAASLLLHFLAVALLACIAAGATLYLYWAFNDVVSTYRRHMNAAAYDAQQFFDQREALLRSVSASAVRNNGSRFMEEALARAGAAPQIEVLPLQSTPGAYDWALVLTHRDLQRVALASTKVVYSSPRDASALRVSARDPLTLSPISTDIQEWLTRTLTNIDIRPATHGQSRIIWLHPPQDTAKRLFLFTPLDPGEPEAGWIGLEVRGVESAVNMPRAGAGNYVLFDERSRPVLHSPGGTAADRTLAHTTREDAFGLQGQGWIPDYLVLSKSVGEDGWRLVYYTPFLRVLQDNAVALQTAAFASLLLTIAVVLQVRYIRRQLVLPALRQYEALADSVSLNQKLIEVAPVGLCLLRRTDGALVLSNDMARRWFRGTPGWRAEILSRDGNETTREYKLGDGRSAYLTFAPTTYRGEAVVLCGISDISPLKRVEQSLLQAKRDAEAANEAKTVFLTTMSHEIRTPLYGILGTLELFSLTSVSGQQAQYLETIQQSSASLLRTINDTLDISRIEAGHTALQCAPFSPVELMNNVVASFAARAHAKGLRAYAVADPDSPAAVIGDATRIRQILDNLVSNAIKFTESGQIVLRLKLDGSDLEGADLSFQVADTGPGIASAHQSRLFDPYYQIAADGPAALPGTGLGLSICRRLAEMMDGQLNAVSESGLGTSVTFEVRLPHAPDAPEPASPRLEGTAVYVLGAVPEIVNNLCEWLRRWGAVALPYPAGGATPPCPGVLVHAWPHASRRGQWREPQVIIHPPGLPAQGEDSPSTWFANAYSLASIRHAVLLAQSGSVRSLTPDAKTPIDTLNLRVLVTEDNPISQLILREQLEHLGCAVVLAGNGEEALNLPDLMRFDAVLTDLNMPRLDGYTFTRRLRQRGYAGPILGITANAFPDEQRRGMEAGMTCLLVKPLALDALRQTLQSIKTIPN
ncbi:hybrid sensor histidine kinase/response regulator [Achromobacter sp. UMC46]|nr:ATP-binding protein [Achromobacter sp. UMC46]MBB1594558.1 hybrid sensor histidine kinase/response regulator [Achromobacter sp. UMC46]